MKKTHLFLILFSNILFYGYSQNVALHFDGVDDFVEIPKTVGNFDTNEDFTVSIWVKPDQKQAELLYEDNDILEKWSQFGGGYPFVIRYYNQSNKNLEGRVSVARYDGETSSQLFSNVKINDGKWHNIIFIKSKSTINLYIDGQLSESNIDRTVFSTKNDSPLYIGVRGNKINHFKGAIDELNIWNRANTSILNNIYLPIDEKAKKGLIVSYHFSEGKINAENKTIGFIKTQNPEFPGKLFNFDLQNYQSNFVNSFEFESEEEDDIKKKISILIVNPYVLENGKKTVYDKEILVAGRVKSEVGISKVLINQKLADYNSSESFFQANIQLNYGENKIKIEAFDINQKKSELEFTIFRNKVGQDILDEAPIIDNNKRIALVIGNAAYENTRALANPINDARLMANTLKKLGFEVIKLENGTKKQIRDSIIVFKNKLKESKETSGLFYYAGHGIQDKKNHNYLIPVEAKIEDEEALSDDCYDMERLLSNLQDAGNNLNIIILDACRNNPFARSFRGGESGGLAEVKNPAIGTYIAYATAPGNVADDGKGENGLYTQELVKALQIPKLKIEDVFKNTKTNVYKLSGQKQLPWENSFFLGNFYFNLK
jgi:Caspase domain/Concanavalin A-like lectin/glucanases superfamily